MPAVRANKLTITPSRYAVKIVAIASSSERGVKRRKRCTDRPVSRKAICTEKNAKEQRAKLAIPQNRAKESRRG